MHRGASTFFAVPCRTNPAPQPKSSSWLIQSTCNSPGTTEGLLVWLRWILAREECYGSEPSRLGRRQCSPTRTLACDGRIIALVRGETFVKEGHKIQCRCCRLYNLKFMFTSLRTDILAQRRAVRVAACTWCTCTNCEVSQPRPSRYPPSVCVAYI